MEQAEVVKSRFSISDETKGKLTTGSIVVLALGVIITFFGLTVSGWSLVDAQVTTQVPKLQHVYKASIAALIIGIVGAFIVGGIAGNAAEERTKNIALTLYLVATTICLMIVTFILFGTKESDMAELTQAQKDKIKKAKNWAIASFVFTTIAWLWVLFANRSSITMANIKTAYGIPVAASEPLAATSYYYF